MPRIWRETLEASEFDNTWDLEQVGTGCTSDGDSALPAANGILTSTKCYKTITVNNTTGKDAYVYENWGSDESTLAYTGWLYIGAESLANGESVALYQVTNSSAQLVYILYLFQVSGFLFLIPFYYDNGSLKQGTASAVTTGTWNLIQLFYSTDSDLYQFVHNFSVIQTVGLTGSLRTPRRIFIGQFGNQGTSGCTVYWDALEWDDTTYVLAEYILTVTPDTFALALSQHQPTLSYDMTVTPATQALALTQHAPTVFDIITVTPATFELALTQHAPALSFDMTVTPATQALVLEHYAPTVIDIIKVTPATQALALTQHAPTLSFDMTVTPATQALVLAQYAPVISTEQIVTVYPETFELALTQHEPEAITRYTEIPPLMHKDLIDPYSGGAWLWLCEFAMPGQATQRIARNTEDVRYDGEDYEKFNMQISEQMFSGDGSIPRVTLRIFQDANRVMEKIVNDTGGALGANVKLIRVNENFLTTPVSALEFDYDALASVSDTEWVTFTLGIPNPLTQRFPLWFYNSSMCHLATPSLFGGPECQYAGPDPTCTGTYEDCYLKGNAENWGGEPGLDPNVVRI